MQSGERRSGQLAIANSSSKELEERARKGWKKELDVFESVTQLDQLVLLLVNCKTEQQI